jgi:adenosylcobinamide kinase/adenosylcobinamide-phosphate guanylyltransferase
MTSIQPGSVLVLGGARSGKSTFAEKLVTASGLRMHYVATGRAWDGEMQARITEHRDRRGPEWQTHEEPLELTACLKAIDAPDCIVLIDCLTLWVTNLMMEHRDIAAEFERLAAYVPQAKARLSSSRTRSGWASCRRTGWRATFATMPAGCTRSLRRYPQTSILSRLDCR